jgi:hypothetical protein
MAKTKPKKAKKSSKRNKKQPTVAQLAGRTFTVRVTRQDILDGYPENPNYCPIALAITRATGVKDVEVEAASIRVDGLEAIDLVPEEIQTFVQDFDYTNDDDGHDIPALKRVRPFKFRLTLPVPVSPGEIEIL